MSPKRARHGTPEEEDKSGLERRFSLSRRSNSLRGLRFPRKTHEAPSPSEEENFKREWGMTMAQEVRCMPIMGLHLLFWGFPLMFIGSPSRQYLAVKTESIHLLAAE